MQERDETVAAGVSRGSAGGGARLAELCREDKAKVARLMQASAYGRRERFFFSFGETVCSHI